MLFKMSLRNIRNSMKDYAIYFFTLIIGVSIFYAFNAIGGQAATLKLSSGSMDIIDLLKTMLSGVSVFVAVVLGLLIIYASRFLMKRRHKEFAIYMTLGMGKGKISAILLTETIFIGLGSLGIGLLVGIGLSQLMSALVISLFEADLSAYKLVVSGRAIVLTIIFFVVMYLVVMLFNSVAVTKLKLIDLLYSEKKSERIKIRKPLVCILIFIIAVSALGYAYYMVAFDYKTLTTQKITLSIALGGISTFLIFFSVSGMLHRIIMSMKKVYYKGLNTFTFRQVTSKVNTMVFSMTVICLMLFVTICALSSAFSIRNSMNKNLKELCPADAEFKFLSKTYNEDTDELIKIYDLEDLFKETDFKPENYFEDYREYKLYVDQNFTVGNFLSLLDSKELASAGYFQATNILETIMKLSDYNTLMEFYGKETLTLSDNEYAVLCNYDNMLPIRNRALEPGTEITVFGRTLKPKYDYCIEGQVELSSQRLNTGIFIVPDSVPDESEVVYDCITGNYTAKTKEEKMAVDAALLEDFKKAREDFYSINPGDTYFSYNTRSDVYDSTVGLGAIITFLGLYIGVTFLIACGAILALNGLSDCVDSTGRYEMIRKIGVEEESITRSLLAQTEIFFLLPLLLAIIHSYFGMRFSSFVLNSMGTRGTTTSILITSLIILIIYGGYFLITFFTGKRIIRNK
ncbi:MAG: ABC transporter permease [Lachnospiraceae bacterium]|nr:ABC transporter permease [Lachnospiraceae bacterium]